MRIDRGEKGKMSLFGETPDRELDEILGNFKTSVHAWSDAAYNRPRTVVSVARHRSWRLATSVALGCVLVAGSLTGGLHERNLHRKQVQEQARIAAAELAERQQLAAKQKSREDDTDLMATVDTDVSRAVPSAMEPLARLMDEDTNP